MHEEHLAWPGAAKAVARNATILRAVILVAFVCFAVVFSTAGVYLRNWSLQFQIQDLKDKVLISNQPDAACQGELDGQWVYGPREDFANCEARQRNDFTRSDREIYDQCEENHKYLTEEHCQRGKEVRIYVFNVTNPQDVAEGLTPRIVEVGRKSDGGPFVFYEDCKTFDTDFGSKNVEFNEYCFYTYKAQSTEAADLGQEIVTVNVGLQEVIGNSVKNIDYIVPVVWGTLGLDALNATTTSAEDYIRGQLLSFRWPDDFGAHFLNHFSQAPDKAGFRARDNARELFEMVLDKSEQFCKVNGTQYDRNQCVSMANTLRIYSRRYYESFQTFNIHPYGLRYKQGAGLLVRAKIGDLLGYYEGYSDPISAYLFPKKVSWNAVRTQTQADVAAALRAGVADAEGGILNAGPLGRSSVVANTIEDLGSLTRFQGRTFVTEFDFKGCRPRGDNAEVVVPTDGPYPPQCNGGKDSRVYGSLGMQVKPRVWNLQEGVDTAESIHIFSKTLMRPLEFSVVKDVELSAGGADVVLARSFELQPLGLERARMAFNCEEVFKAMARVNVINRGSDCDAALGMFDLTPVSNNIPYKWSLPHFYLTSTKDSSQHPRSNLIGLVTPTGPRYRSMVIVEPESGRVLEHMLKEQISIQLFADGGNYFYTKHKPVIIPLYWKFETKNLTIAERRLLAGFQSSFTGLFAGFIVCLVVGGLSLVAALCCGMILYREGSLQTVEEKRKRIQAELALALPPKRNEDEDADGEEAILF